MSERSPQSLSHYRLDEKIGEGGMGAVYRATDVELQRPVAIKFISEASLAKLGHDSFLREARFAAALNHPNVCTIHEVGEVQADDDVALEEGVRISAGTPYLVMELVEGATLARRLEEGQPFDLDEVLEIAGQIADALAEAHGRGIVHRDLKPQNVVVTASGRIKIVDFGLAKALRLLGGGNGAASETLTVSQPGIFAGTPAYMSPEQATGQEVDARSDIFSFGTLLYELVFGRHPFGADSLPVTLARIVEAEPEARPSLGEEIPQELTRIIRRCLQKRPDRRYNDTRDLVNSLRDLQAINRQPVAELTPVSNYEEARVSGPTQLAFSGWRSRQRIPGLEPESFAQILSYVLGQQEERGSWPGHGDHWSEVKTACILKALATLGFRAEDQWCVGEGSSRIIGGPARSLDFLAGRLSALDLSHGLVGEDIWDTCQTLLALAGFGQVAVGAQYANHINLYWAKHYRTACDTIPASIWAGPAYLAAMCDVLVSYKSVLDSESRIGDIVGELESLEHTEHGGPVGCFRAANSADPNKHRWNTGLTLRSLGNLQAGGSGLAVRSCEWVLDELDSVDRWLGATDRESPMYLARCLAGLLAASPWVGKALEERISRALQHGNARLDGFWSPLDSERTGDLKSYTAVLEYLAEWTLTVPAGLVLGVSISR